MSIKTFFRILYGLLIIGFVVGASVLINNWSINTFLKMYVATITIVGAVVWVGVLVSNAFDRINARIEENRRRMMDRMTHGHSSGP